MAEARIIGNMEGKYEIINRVYDKEALCPTLNTCQGGGHEPKIIDKCIVAMRGRNPERPTDRTPGLPTEQRLEPNFNNTVNTLTTVQKDNMVLEIVKSTRGADVVSTIRASYYKNGERNIMENIKNGNGYEGVIEIKQATKEGSVQCKVGGCYDSSFPNSKTRRGRVQSKGDITPTLTASSSENINYVETQYRIRKLTPRECWRLMGYTDADFNNAQNAGVSNTQLYKQAGNAIVKQVLMAIFLQMGIQGKKKWNDMTKEER